MLCLRSEGVYGLGVEGFGVYVVGVKGLVGLGSKGLVA